MHIRLSPIPALTCALLALLAVPAAAQKADTLLLRNGDRIIGEVKQLENGLLDYKTDNMSTISVKWDRVVSLTSRWYYEVEDRQGVRYFGTFARPDSSGYLAIVLNGVALVPLSDVVRINRIKQTQFWGRIDGYLDVGFSFAKSNKTVQLTSNLEATYLVRSWSVILKGDLFAQRQKDANPTQRWSVQPNVVRFLGRRWLLGGQGRLQHNGELGLSLRTLISLGGGRQFVQTNSHDAAGLVGLAAQREWYVDSTQASGERVSDNLEALVSGSYRAFRYDSPQLDATATAQVYPSLTDFGRVRLEGDFRIRYEVLSDFYITPAFQVSMDSRPPNPDTPKSDYTTTLSISWKF